MAVDIDKAGKCTRALYTVLWECLNAMQAWGAMEDGIPEEFAKVYQTGLAVLAETSTDATRPHFEHRLERFPNGDGPLGLWPLCPPALPPLLLSSEEWCQALEIDPRHMDPDGWDRMNWEYSFQRERITRAEFNTRLMMSTCWDTTSIYLHCELERQKQMNAYLKHQLSRIENEAKAREWLASQGAPHVSDKPTIPLPEIYEDAVLCREDFEL